MNRRAFFRALVGAVVGAKALPSILEAATVTTGPSQAAAGALTLAKIQEGMRILKAVEVGPAYYFFAPSAIYRLGPHAAPVPFSETPWLNLPPGVFDDRMGERNHDVDVIKACFQ